MSTTETVKDFAVAALPAASLASQVTVALPSANWEPEAGEHLTGTLPS